MVKYRRPCSATQRSCEEDREGEQVLCSRGCGTDRTDSQRALGPRGSCYGVAGLTKEGLLEFIHRPASGLVKVSAPKAVSVI